MEQPGVETVDPRVALPSTVTYIGYHAARCPKDVAVIMNGKEITYDAVYRDIGKTVATLRDLGLGPGHSVAMDIPNFYLELLTTLSFEALGVATFNYNQNEAPLVEALLAAVDLVLCASGNEPPNAKRVHVVDQAWLDEMSARKPERPVQTAPIGPDTPVRIVRSSGTTGSIKVMVHTARVHRLWIDQFQFRTGSSRQVRFLLTFGFVLQVYHSNVVACLRMGGACVYDDRTDVAEALTRNAITHATFLPSHLMQAMENLPKDYVKAKDLTVFIIGAPMPKAARDQVIQVLADDVMEVYGTNEACGICTMDGDGVGTVLPGVRVEVVDDDDRPVIGEPGLVRVMSSGVVAGYINNPAATRLMFRDGWFYPGDVAVMTDAYSLRLLGRIDDLLNIRGVKYSATALEEILIRELPVNDLLVLPR